MQIICNKITFHNYKGCHVVLAAASDEKPETTFLIKTI